MSSKKKLIISMLVVSFVLLSIIATVAIAFALTQQTIKTTLNINYTVEDIDGTASATYTIGGVTESLVAMKGTQVIGDKLVFKAGDTENAGNLMFPEDALALTAQNDNVVIQYTYSNTGAKHYIASMDFAANIEADNMKVEYSIDGTTYSEDRYAVVVPANTSNRSYWIKISIADKSKSASFTGDFDWLLSGCDEQSDSYLSMPKLEFQGSNGAYSVNIASNSQYIGNLVFPREVNGDPVTTIAANRYLTQAQKDQVTSVYIPDSVTRLEMEAAREFGTFQGFTNLETITFEQNETAGAASAQSGSGLKFIDGQAFMDCKSLREFKMPDTVTEVEDGWGYQFQECTNLRNIIWGAGATNIPCGAFNNCVNLEEFTIPSTVKSIDFSAFQGSGLVSIIIPDNLTAIGYSLFKDCNNLKTVTIGKGVKTIYGEAFYNCKNLTSIIIPENIEEIEYSAFEGCTGLTSIEIPENVTTIGTRAFYGCSGLKEVTVWNVQLLRFFEFLSNMENLTVMAGCCDFVMIDAKMDFNKVNLHLGVGVNDISVDIVSSAPASISIDPGNEKYKVKNGCVIDNIEKSLILGLANAEIPTDENLTKIGESAFNYRQLLKTNIVIPETITEIGRYAFMQSNITSITIPNSVNLIKEGAVAGCSSLTSIEFANKTGWICEGVNITFPETMSELVNMITNDMFYYSFDWTRS